MLTLACETAGNVAQRADGEATAFVMAEIVRVVEEGHAAMTRLQSGVLELRFATGELFHLSDKGITRIA